MEKPGDGKIDKKNGGIEARKNIENYGMESGNSGSFENGGSVNFRENGSAENGNPELNGSAENDDTETGESLENGGIEARKNEYKNGVAAVENSEKKFGIKEKIQRYLNAYKGLPKSRKQKVLSLISAVLILVIAAPIVVGAIVNAGGERYLLDVYVNSGRGKVEFEAAGKKTDDGTYVQVGSSVKAKAVPDAHYSFAGWFDGNNRKFPNESEYLSKEISFRMIKDNLNLQARFTLDTYGLKVTSKSDTDGETGGRFSVGVGGHFGIFDMNKRTFEKSYEEGTEITLTIPASNDLFINPDPGFGFFGWFDVNSGKRLSGDVVYKFTATAESRDIEARFYKIFNEGGKIQYDESERLPHSSGTGARGDHLQGIPDDPFVYEISTKEQLALVAFLLNRDGRYTKGGNADTYEKFVLINDINLCGAEWIPIGNAAHKFNGIFDGNGFEIANFKVNIDTNGTDDVYAGLFGYVTYGAKIENLKIRGAEIAVNAPNAGNIYAGALAGKIEGAALKNLTVIGGELTVSGGKVKAGMIAGEISNPAEGKVFALRAVLKLAGEGKSEAGKVSVKASGEAYAGGIAGYFGNGGNVIENSAAAADVLTGGSSGTVYAGRVFGGCSNAGVSLTNTTGTGKINNAEGKDVGVYGK
ncbi:MAG: hypothetical protein LBP62_00455 [Clostridiales bacterium]|jgi:hypothetical protein|nr:hypothetical protein [Clostridiales bacterium]